MSRNKLVHHFGAHGYSLMLVPHLKQQIEKLEAENARLKRMLKAEKTKDEVLSFRQTQQTGKLV